jgi:branched-chain amino acid aminotransferase
LHPCTRFCRPLRNYSAKAPYYSSVIIAYYRYVMAYKYFSRNGTLLPATQAVVSLDDVQYSYGFGVYETIRVAKGSGRFLKEHCQRLMESARIIGLPHPFSAEFVAQSAEALTAKNEIESCNLKVLLIGGPTPEAATLNIICLNPLFPDRKLYKEGVHTITKEAERPFPHAKTLNMLPSFLAYREAKAADAYDALLINRHGCVTEGTSTNFFVLKDRVIFSPKEADILLGVTRDNVLKVARKNGFKVVEQDLKLADTKYYDHYDSLFLTSTYSKIMPIRSVDRHVWGPPSEPLRELMVAFNKFLD